MAIIPAPRRSARTALPLTAVPTIAVPVAPVATTRDGAIDLVRALCVAAVVALHALMVGVIVDASGPVFANAAEGASWFAPLTWVLQVMPLFFVVGGFAGASAFRRRRARGGTRAEFVAGRVQRLLVPAVVVVGVVGAALAALAMAGVPADLVAVAGWRFAQPLWFLGVFLLCQALLPVLLVAHERRPLTTIGALAAAAVVVDLARAATGLEAIGILNLALVWLALQQIGFFLADGRIDALRRRTRVLVLGGAVAALAASFAGGIYSHDLIANLNPPTTALLIVGVAQTAAFSLLRDRLDSLSRSRRIAGFTRFVTERTMTIYLWHMPVLLAMAGASALFALSTGIALPEPSSAAWWVTRPVWLAAALILTAVVACALAGVERRRMPRPAASVALVPRAVALGIGAVVLLLVVGTTAVTAAIAVTMMLVALRWSSERRAADHHQHGGEHDAGEQADQPIDRA